MNGNTLKELNIKNNNNANTSSRSEGDTSSSNNTNNLSGQLERELVEYLRLRKKQMRDEETARVRERVAGFGAHIGPLVSDWWNCDLRFGLPVHVYLLIRLRTTSTPNC